MQSETSSGTGSSVNTGTEQDTATTPESAPLHTACSYAGKQPLVLLAMGSSLIYQISAFHGLQKNIFQRIAPEIHPPDAHLPFRRQPENVARLHSIRQDHLHAVCRHRAFTAELLNGFRKVAVRAVSLEFQKTLVRAALFFQIRIMRDPPLLSGSALRRTCLRRRAADASTTQSASPCRHECRGSCGSCAAAPKDPAHSSARQGSVTSAHAQSPAPASPVASCPANTFPTAGNAPPPTPHRTTPRARVREPCPAGKPESSPIICTNDTALIFEMNASFSGMYPTNTANLSDFGCDVVAKHSRRARRGFVEAEEGIDQRRFAGAIRTQQSDGSPAQRSRKPAQDIAVAKANRKTLQFNQRRKRSGSRRLVHSRRLPLRVVSSYSLTSVMSCGSARRPETSVAGTAHDRPSSTACPDQTP